MVRGRNNGSFKLPDQSEGSGRTLLILYVSNTQGNISQYPEPKMSQVFSLQKVSVLSALSSVNSCER